MIAVIHATVTVAIALAASIMLGIIFRLNREGLELAQALQAQGRRIDELAEGFKAHRRGVGETQQAHQLRLNELDRLSKGSAEWRRGVEISLQEIHREAGTGFDVDPEAGA